MSDQEFKDLKYGHVIHYQGQLHMVQQVIYDGNGDAEFVGLAPALDIVAGADATLVSDKPGVLYLKDHTTQPPKQT